jgi:hypothetical protein
MECSQSRRFRAGWDALTELDSAADLTPTRAQGHLVDVALHALDRPLKDTHGVSMQPGGSAVWALLAYAVALLVILLVAARSGGGPDIPV